MIVTEAEARKKWCPKARWALGAEDNNAGNRFSNDNNPESCRCISSECMAWRWATEDGKPVYLPTSEKWTCEYCDGQGKHEKFIVDDPEQPECRNPEGICHECEGQGSGYKHARAGYCGLAGVPS